MPVSSGFIQDTMFFGSSPGSIGALPEEAPDISFVREWSFFPTTLKIDQPFTAQWIFDNNGFAGEAGLGLIYEGNQSILWHYPMPAGVRAHITTGEYDYITDFVPSIPYSQTVHLRFIVGYYDESIQKIYYNDPEGIWDVSVYVDEGGGFTSTTGLVIGGVILVGLGVALLYRK